MFPKRGFDLKRHVPQNRDRREIPFEGSCKNKPFLTRLF